MNRMFILVLLTVMNYPLAQGQCGTTGTINFDPYRHCLTIDTPSIWQIGKPQKTILDTAHSFQNVIITDTINPYPPNDTSSFTIGTYAYAPSDLKIAGYYNVNSDSLNDYGVIEISSNRLNWVDINSLDPLNGRANWPVLTGNSNGWRSFFIVADIYELNFQYTPLFVRFSFISDGNPDTLDGLMFDDIGLSVYFFGIDEINFEQIKSTASPNPTTNSLTIGFDNIEHSSFQLAIYDNLGRLIFTKNNVIESLQVETQQMESGLFFYKLTNFKDKKVARGNFIIER